MESVVRGGTKWKRFAVVMVPSVAATAVIGMALAQGALAASFAVSGQSFKVSADRLDGEGFVQYGGLDAKAGGAPEPVAVSGFKKAYITKMCQSVVVPVPGFGSVSLNLHAGTDGASDPNKRVEADNLYIDLNQLDADAEFKDINIGVAAGSTNKAQGPATTPGQGGPALPNSFAQEARVATLTDVKQTAWATSAGTFKLKGLSMSVKAGVHECY
ncbi:DUF6230 family protein [Streptomyces sp. H10-C2]|uniref:DUF6230 family protein n=1 Tax=unclassified Streptomyces TaxID=2593676 RepID=UPI0024BB91FA|nr:MULTISPECIES: DUF6230 family protein [unclassified Streptomyces]MDJ0341478.1 DUF6230 family protein [Streptomyces sp. PH10-H1]MDJ0369135.1 DUF6230 family protein [Streptomyces sp. H10-C2]